MTNKKIKVILIIDDLIKTVSATSDTYLSVLKSDQSNILKIDFKDKDFFYNGKLLFDDKFTLKELLNITPKTPQDKEFKIVVKEKEIQIVKHKLKSLEKSPASALKLLPDKNNREKLAVTEINNLLKPKVKTKTNNSTNLNIRENSSVNTYESKSYQISKISKIKSQLVTVKIENYTSKLDLMNKIETELVMPAGLEKKNISVVHTSEFIAYTFKNENTEMNGANLLTDYLNKLKESKNYSQIIVTIRFTETLAEDKDKIEEENDKSARINTNNSSNNVTNLKTHNQTIAQPQPKKNRFKKTYSEMIRFTAKSNAKTNNNTLNTVDTNISSIKLPKHSPYLNNAFFNMGNIHSIQNYSTNNISAKGTMKTTSSTKSMLKTNIINKLTIPSDFNRESSVKKKEYILHKQQELLDMLGPQKIRITVPYVSEYDQRILEENKSKKKWIVPHGFNSRTATKDTNIRLPEIGKFVQKDVSTPPGHHKFRDINKKSWVNKKGFMLAV